MTPAGLLLLGFLLLEPATWGLSRGSLSSQVVGSTWVILGVAGTGREMTVGCRVPTERRGYTGREVGPNVTELGQAESGVKASSSARKSGVVTSGITWTHH